MTSKPLSISAPALAAADREALRAALVAAGGNVYQASQALKISWATCKRRIKQLDLSVWLRDTYSRSHVQKNRRAREREG